MLKSLAKVIFILLLVVGGSVGIVLYRDHFGLDHRVSQLEQEKFQLQQVVQRLTDEHRVAQLLVTDQQIINGKQQTTLVLQEFGRDGGALTPKTFTIAGNVVHIDAMLIKFEHDFVKQNDPLRGHSITLFHKLYGDEQTPEAGFPIDTPGQIPDYYRGSDPMVSEFENKLWSNFWQLADDAKYRQQMGVRVANGQGVWLPVTTDKVYTLTIESDGGLNYSSEPLQGIYKDAMRQHTGA